MKKILFLLMTVSVSSCSGVGTHGLEAPMSGELPEPGYTSAYLRLDAEALTVCGGDYVKLEEQVVGEGPSQRLRWNIGCRRMAGAS